MEFFESFRKDIPWTDHLTKSQSMRAKHKERVPIIVDRGTKETPQVTKNKFLVPDSFTIAQFQAIVRRYLKPLEGTDQKKLQPQDALFFFIREYKYESGVETHSDKLVPAQQTLGQLYQQYQDRNGYLFIVYNKETTFG